MKLYFMPGACSLSPHIVLKEIGAQFEAVRVTNKDGKKTIENGDFSKVNPKGQVPTLQTDDGKILTEGAVIVQYIADKYPEKNLLPKWGTWERYKANEWLNFVASELHKNLGILFGLDRTVTNAEGNAQFREGMKQNLAKKFDFLSEHFKTNQFLMGHQFTAADAYLFTVLSWHGMVKVDLTPWPQLLGFMERMKSRPTVQAAMKAEGLI